MGTSRIFPCTMMARAAMLLVLVIAGLGAVTGVGCEKKPAASGSNQLTVLAAASLADAFREVGAAFEATALSTKVEFSFGGSNQLRTQLENGASGGVFASADRKQMDAAVVSKVVDASTVRVFARNRLALIVPKSNPAGIKSLSDLARPGLKIVVADKAVPVGNYTRQMLAKAGEASEFGPSFVSAFDANTVSREENVAAVVAKIALNEADAGIAYASDAAGSNGPKLTVLLLPAALEQQAEYVCAVITRAPDPKLAQRFIDFLVSKDASAILSKRGFMGPDAGSR
ncbi:MAG: molybdate ABC transporter substrate-binding protein [Phycisphaerales bacterium]